MPKSPYRPTHTGSARVQAQREAKHRSFKPTHVRLPHAAVAIEPEPVTSPATGPSVQVRHARHPLPLSEGRQALALRRRGDKPLEVLVRDAQGHRRWEPLASTVPVHRWEEWGRHGFASGSVGPRRSARKAAGPRAGAARTVGKES